MCNPVFRKLHTGYVALSSDIPIPPVFYIFCTLVNNVQFPYSAGFIRATLLFSVLCPLIPIPPVFNTFLETNYAGQLHLLTFLFLAGSQNPAKDIEFGFIGLCPGK